MDPIDQKLSRYGLNNSTQLIQNLLASTEPTPPHTDEDDPGELSKWVYNSRPEVIHQIGCIMKQWMNELSWKALLKHSVLVIEKKGEKQWGKRKFSLIINFHFNFCQTVFFI